MAKAIEEGSARISLAKGVFFNPEMELCRSVFSLAVGAIGGKIDLVDAMCASGARGIRYKLENGNVGKLALVDANKSAVACARKNAAKNRVKCRVAHADANGFLRENAFDFLELDPFGSPQPFLHDAARSLAAKDNGWLCATATDVAVLCGAHHAACLKNYAAAPLNNEFCHENACRILSAAVAREFAPFNLAATPAFTLSHRHYVKVLFSVSRGAEKSVEAMKKIGFVSYCPSCQWRDGKRLPLARECPYCKAQLQIGGSLYIGALWDSALLERMLLLNAERKYSKAKEIEKLLFAMRDESRIDAIGYYDLHVVAKKRESKILPIEEAVEKIRKAGFAASRTHFCPTAVRTDAPHGKALELLSGKSADPGKMKGNA
ncbi:MAG: tRNA (guanine(10)-N(2))-dimethyltransferase [Candidatus Micrarchaeia archaeon]